MSNEIGEPLGGVSATWPTTCDRGARFGAAAPAGPCGPAGLWGPVAPCGPVVFQDVKYSSWRQFVVALTIWTAPLFCETQA